MQRIERAESSHAGAYAAAAATAAVAVRASLARGSGARHAMQAGVVAASAALRAALVEQAEAVQARLGAGPLVEDVSFVLKAAQERLAAQGILLEDKPGGVTTWRRR
jgi:hypothetical protein